MVYHDENYEGESDGVYGETKRKAERKLIDLHKYKRLWFKSTRPPLVYGEGVKGNLEVHAKIIKSGFFSNL